MKITTMGMAAAAWLLTIGLAAAAPAPDSKHVSRAKEYIDDEQWSRAIVELQAAVADPKEANRGEALFWLAYSQHQAGDEAAALQSIATLERTAPSSRWVRLGWSLRIEIAQALRRDDVLLVMGSVPPPPPPVPATPPVHPVAAGRAGMPPRPAAPGFGAPVPAAPAPPPTQPVPPGTTPAAAPPAPVPAAPPQMVYVRPAARGRGTAASAPVAIPVPPNADIWLPSSPWSTFDMTLRVQALSSLVDTHAEKAIPLLREIALDPNNPDEARQAVIVLGQSKRPDAQRTVVDAARQGAEPVRLAAVSQLGRFEGPMVASELMQVYTTSTGLPRLRRQVVTSLGERADNAALMHIVTSESEATVRDYAIFMLGRTGARDELRTLYVQAPRVSRPAVLNALLKVKDDDELIRIARTEQDGLLRMRARSQLRVLGTPKALKFLEENP